MVYVVLKQNLFYIYMYTLDSENSDIHLSRRLFFPLNSPVAPFLIATRKETFSSTIWMSTTRLDSCTSCISIRDIRMDVYFQYKFPMQTGFSLYMCKLCTQTCSIIIRHFILCHHYFRLLWILSRLARRFQIMNFLDLLGTFLYFNFLPS